MQEFKRDQMNLNECRSSQSGLNKPKEAPLSLDELKWA